VFESRKLERTGEGGMDKGIISEEIKGTGSKERVLRDKIKQRELWRTRYRSERGDDERERELGRRPG